MKKEMPRESQTSWRSRRSLWVVITLSILIVAIVSIAIALGPWRAGSEDPEIMARVNGEAVTRADLLRVQTDLLALRRLQGAPDDTDPAGKELERLALRQLIQRRLMLQEAARRGLSATEDEFDQALSELRSRFADLESLGAWMQERGLDDRSLINTIRSDLLVRRVTAALVEETAVTEEQVKAYYEVHKEDLIIGQEVRLQIIAADAIEAGEAIMKALNDGVNFSALAREYSLGQRAAEGGDTGWVDPVTLPPLLRQAVGRLKEGEATGPLEKSPDEFLIVALAGRRPVQAKNFDEAQAEIERRLLPATQQAAVQQWLAEQEERSKIELYLQPE